MQSFKKIFIKFEILILDFQSNLRLNASLYLVWSITLTYIHVHKQNFFFVKMHISRYLVQEKFRLFTNMSENNSICFSPENRTSKSVVLNKILPIYLDAV